MQSVQHRCLIVIVLLLIGSLTQASLTDSHEVAPSRWPTDDALYDVSGWAVGPPSVEGILSSASGIRHIIRTYDRPNGAHATLVISTAPVAKSVHKAGADTSFLGAGYTVSPAPPGIVPPIAGGGALLVQGQGASALLLHTAGERRGLLGNGAIGWSLAILDAVLGQANDYYLFRLLVPLDRVDSPVVAEAIGLASTLFPRLAAWYADRT
jgi:hypothetical protein